MFPPIPETGAFPQNRQHPVETTTAIQKNTPSMKRTNPFFRFSRSGTAGLELGSLLLLLLASAAGLSFAGTINPPYEVGTWRSFRTAAVSYTFDDSCANQFTKAVPMFNQAGFKMTLFSCTGTSSGLFYGWQKLTNAAAYGHEIASHTVSHSSMGGMADANQLSELTNSQNAINTNVTNQLCVTLAYPNCVEGKDSLTSQYYIAARTCSGQIVPSTPANLMNISSFVCGNQGLLSASQMLGAASNALPSHGWCVYLIHAIDNDSGYSPLPSTTLQATVDCFRTNQPSFWVDTFGNVIRYILERNNASVMETVTEEDRLTVQVTQTLANSAIFNYPITLRRPVPTAWPGATVTQNNQPVTYQLLWTNSARYIMFDAVPNGGDVTLAKQVLPIVLSSPALSGSSTFSFRLDGQITARYVVSASSDLVNWQPIQTNTLVDTHTNFTLPAPSSLQFYRAQWLP